MKILEPGSASDKPNKYKGKCHNCKAVVECFEEECSLIEVGKPRVIKCPTAGCGYYIPLALINSHADIHFERKEWYITPIKDNPEKEL